MAKAKAPRKGAKKCKICKGRGWFMGTSRSDFDTTPCSRCNGTGRKP